MNEKTPQIVTAKQSDQAAIVTTFLENGGNLSWLPAKVKAARLMHTCAQHSEFEDNEDFEHAAKERMKWTGDAKYSREALEWVQAHVTE